jgi:hypothetical protein
MCTYVTAIASPAATHSIPTRGIVHACSRATGHPEHAARQSIAEARVDP